MKSYENVFAIVRVDKFQAAEVAITNKITVKAIYKEEEQARSETERLNKQKTVNGCCYFYQETRLF